MKYIVFVILISLSACASPIRIKARNCVAIGHNLYECDLVSESRNQGKNNR